MKQNKLYLPDGWVNMRELIYNDMPFVAICGGRGTGKTYGALKSCVEDGVRFVYMRRTQTQVNMVMTPELNPFKKLNRDRGWNIMPFHINQYISGFYNSGVNEKGKVVPVGEPFGYLLALSTISNMRGFDMSDVGVLLLDEFIPEKHERIIKDEASAFFNAYETINRNRELEGQKPLKCVMMSNANDLGNPYFLELKLITRCERMISKGIEYEEDKKRGIGIVILKDSKISELKNDTALYRLTEGTEFKEMAIANEFAGEERGRIGSRNLNEYVAKVQVGEIVIYRHKSKKEFYVCTHISGACPAFGSGPLDLARFRREYLYLWREYMCNTILFESYLCEIMFQKYFG